MIIIWSYGHENIWLYDEDHMIVMITTYCVLYEHQTAPK